MSVSVHDPPPTYTVELLGGEFYALFHLGVLHLLQGPGSGMVKKRLFTFKLLLRNCNNIEYLFIVYVRVMSLCFQSVFRPVRYALCPLGAAFQNSPTGRPTARRQGSLTPNLCGDPQPQLPSCRLEASVPCFCTEALKRKPAPSRTALKIIFSQDVKPPLLP